MKNKRGLFLFLGILIAIVILLIGAGIYFYNFHVFKTLRVCLSEGESTDIPCENPEICRDFAITIMPDLDMKNAPEFLRDSFDKIIEESIYCDKTCYIRKVRGADNNTQNFELLKSCEKGEIEIETDIRGRDAIETLKWLKNKSFK